MAQYTFRFQFRTGAPGREGEGGAVAGVCPDRARSLASMALPVARHAGLFKFKEFQSRARTQACQEARNAMLVPFFFRLKLAPEQGVVAQHA